MDEDLKQKVLVSFVVFDVVIIGYQLIFNLSPFSVGRLLLGGVFALLAAGIAFGVMHFLSRR